MKYLKSLILLLSLSVLVTSCSGSKWISGNWEGEGIQIDGKKWDVHLISTNKEHVKIDYPSLSCGGVWTILKEDKKEIIFLEKIEYGTTKCDQGNEVFVSKVDENSIKLIFYLRSYDPVNPIAEAILYKSTKTIE